MFDEMDAIAWGQAQGDRSRKLFSAVVLAVLDDAVRDEKKLGPGAGVESVIRWARSKDGKLVLTCAGIDPTERAVKGLAEFVRRGERVSSALRLGDDSAADDIADAA
ncbi:MAG: DUF6280 family protein [Rubrimonas sp.]